MSDTQKSARFVFPKWANYVLPAVIIASLGAAPYMGLLVPFALNPTTLNVGYQPKQPVAYSHDLHVNQLGLDCRYCHNTVEKSGFAAIPALGTCMNCHTSILEGTRGKDSRSEIAKLRSHYFEKDPVTQAVNADAGKPIEWIKVHDLPDFVYFNHSAHVNAGVSCVSCHNRVDRMGRDGVYIAQPLSMGWCLDCHREPLKNLRPASEVTNLAWGVAALSDSQAAEIQKLGTQTKDASIGAALAAVKPGQKLDDETRKKIGTVLADSNHRQIRNAFQLSDCYLCHR